MSERIEDIADGLALWQEHKPTTIEDWQNIARRFSEQVDAQAKRLRLADELADAVGPYLRAVADHLQNVLRGHPSHKSLAELKGRSDELVEAEAAYRTHAQKQEGDR